MAEYDAPDAPPARRDGAAAGPRTVVQVRLTPEEKDELSRRAAGAGTTVSGYVRACAVHPEAPTASEADALRALLLEMSREGTNLNQLARQANAGGLSGLEARLSDTLARLMLAADSARAALDEYEGTRRGKKDAES